MKMPMCECGTELEAVASYSGCDWLCEAGEGSGFDYEFVLECPACSRQYPMVFMKNTRAISPRKGIKMTWC